MTETLHEHLIWPVQLCEMTRQRLLDVLGAIPPENWNGRPREGAWTPAEQADHLILAEIGTSKMVRRLIRGDFAALVRPADAQLHDSRLDSYPYNALPAPDVLLPKARAQVDVAELLDAAHRRFAEELRRFKGDDADALFAPDPATGVWFTLAGWVRLQALHESHHIRQLEETSASGF